MALQVHNVRTRRKEPFRPLGPGGITMYVCGLTVYDHTHIGHARTAVGFEVVRRWLEHSAKVEGWGTLRYVQNVTDVDDKIIARAKESGISPREHAALWDKRCARQMERLGVRPPDEAPHVTQSIPDIVDFIQAIIKRGHAYATREGNVYFDVPGYQAKAEKDFPREGYGSLSNRDYKEMAAGTRKEVETDKRHPADFALWKSADAGDHPEANWESPWGRGRPGWHIECSLMATRSLGDQIDLHGGGQDLIFPHHENEVAQSQAKTGKAPFVNFWMHTGFLNVEGEKMSKSLGNFIPLETMLDDLDARKVPPDALRLYFVQTHYRSKIDFSRKGLDEATTALERLERTRGLLADTVAAARPGAAALDGPLAKASHALEQAFGAAMDDDFHTPGALAALFEFQRAANAAVDGQTVDQHLGSAAAAKALAAMEACGQVLTLFAGPAGTSRAQVDGTVPPRLAGALAELGLPVPASEAAAMESVLQARTTARAAKAWSRADSIRTTLATAGYLVEDTPAGQRWRRA